MSDIKWIKLSTSMFDDEKIKLIESMPDKDSILIIWIKLLVMAGRVNDSGYIYLSSDIPYTDEMLSTVFSRPLNTIRLALNLLQKFNMISINEKNMHITNWDKHQNINGMERVRELTRSRVEKFREKQKMLPLHGLESGNVTQRYSNAIDKNKNKNKEIDKEVESSSRQLNNYLLTTEEMSKVTNTYEEEIGKLTQIVCDEINIAFQNYTFKDIMFAIKQASLQQHRSWKYVLGVLENRNNGNKETKATNEKAAPQWLLEGTEK